MGFTDLSRLRERCCHRSGQYYLPDKEFRYLRTVHLCSRRLMPARGLATLHVAMQIGLYHHRLRDARRVVSEGILSDLPC